MRLNAGYKMGCQQFVNKFIRYQIIIHNFLMIQINNFVVKLITIVGMLGPVEYIGLGAQSKDMK